jgi:hypothetical protein
VNIWKRIQNKREINGSEFNDCALPIAPLSKLREFRTFWFNGFLGARWQIIQRPNGPACNKLPPFHKEPRPPYRTLRSGIPSICRFDAMSRCEVATASDTSASWNSRKVDDWQPAHADMRRELRVPKAAMADWRRGRDICDLERVAELLRRANDVLRASQVREAQLNSSAKTCLELVTFHSRLTATKTESFAINDLSAGRLGQKVHNLRPSLIDSDPAHGDMMPSARKPSPGSVPPLWTGRQRHSPQHTDRLAPHNSFDSAEINVAFAAKRAPQIALRRFGPLP